MANPILTKELRARSRRVGMTVSLTIFALIMTAVAAAVWGTTNSVSSFSSDPVEASTIGTNLFEWVIITMILIMSFLIPGFTGSSISGERDRQTLVPLQVSLLTPHQIVLGKLQASLAYTGLMLTMCVPLFAIAYVVGGITVLQVLLALAGLVVVALLLGSMSILASSLVRRTGPATVLAYAFMLFFVVGMWIVLSIIGALNWFDAAQNLLFFNPLVFVGSLTRLGSSYDASFAPLQSAGSAGNWWASLIAYSVIIAASLVIAAKRVSLPAQRDR